MSKRGERNHEKLSVRPNIQCKDSVGKWTYESMRERYFQYAEMMGLEAEGGDDLYPDIKVYPGNRGWSSELLIPLIHRMKKGDLAAAEIGVELLEEDGGFFFGRCLKANAARALGKCQLTERQKDRVRRRVLGMLEIDFLPREFRQYAWLARRIGMGDLGERLGRVDVSKPWLDWYVRYLTCPNPGRRPRRHYGE